MRVRYRAAQAALFAVLAAGAQARADDIIVFGTVAAKSALEQIAPAFERDTHHKLVLHIATTGELAADIAKGAPFDVALLTQAALDDLIKQASSMRPASSMSRASASAWPWPRA